MIMQNNVQETAHVNGKFTEAVGDRLLLAAAVNPAAVVTLIDSSRFSSAKPTMLPPNPASDILTIDSITSSMLL
jgi:hypothetical protein